MSNKINVFGVPNSFSQEPKNYLHHFKLPPFFICHPLASSFFELACDK
jgi:hypothetical protein